MKYILMMTGTKAAFDWYAKWSKEDFQAQIAFMRAFNQELADTGVLVATEGLAFPDQAKIVRAGSNGEPITDGIFPESKEFLAGFWIIDVESPEQAYQIAGAGFGSAWPWRDASQYAHRGAANLEPCTGSMAVSNPPLAIPLDHLLRELTPQVIGTVVRRFHDFAAAEDAVQEALLAAATQLRSAGLPDNPRAWLTQVAFRRMIDQIRSESARQRRENEVALETAYTQEAMSNATLPQEDDTLLLLFMCCHPALTPASAIALTLRAVGGLTTAEIAHAFFVPEATMAQRISRAKQSIKNSGLPFQEPTPTEREQRLRAVLHILYLIFNEGYTSSVGSNLRRDDLAHEAIRLTRIVYKLQPDDTEVAGLLALMLLTNARHLARASATGELIPLVEQDRTLWDQQQIAEGIALLSATLPKGAVGPYQLQAAIAAVHDEAANAAETDWPQILGLYELLGQMSDNPMVALNHAIAAAMVFGAAKGLDLLKAFESDTRLADQHRLDAVRAHLLELAGDQAGAISHYRAAAGKTASLPERNYLLTQAARLSSAR